MSPRGSFEKFQSSILDPEHKNDEHKLSSDSPTSRNDFYLILTHSSVALITSNGRQISPIYRLVSDITSSKQQRKTSTKIPFAVEHYSISFALFPHGRVPHLSMRVEQDDSVIGQ